MPRKPASPCPVCRALSCGHDREPRRNHVGESSTRRGYDAAYRRARRELIGKPCAMGLPGCTGTATTAQHTDDGGLIPACAHCNYRDGAERANRSRRARSTSAGQPTDGLLYGRSSEQDRGHHAFSRPRNGFIG